MAEGNKTAKAQESTDVQSNEHVKIFFLDLATKGKEAWNEWRRNPANKDVPVTFAGVDFREAPRDEIHFAGFEFGDSADFSGCRWQRAFFDEANFGHWVDFGGATFSHRAYFRAATFGHFSDFSRVTFDELATFAGASFGNGDSFGSGSFDGTSATFVRAIFGSAADFSGASFNPAASFDSAIFQGQVDFSGLSEALFGEKLERCLGPSDETSAQAREALEARHRSSWKRHGCGPDRFLDISFAKARFYADANFSHRSFEDVADFTNARFYRPPNFDGVTNATQIDLTGASVGFGQPGRINWITDSQIPIRLRALRKLAEETKNHDLERDLYIEEREAERGVYLRQLWQYLKQGPKIKWPVNALALLAHLVWIGIMFSYWALADYGHSFVRPVIWLALSVPFFRWRYDEVFAPLMRKAASANAENYEAGLRMLALGNAVPFVGPLTIDSEIKKFLFCAGAEKCLPIPPEGYQSWVIVQNLLSITLVFFIGLALRNYFKIR